MSDLWIILDATLCQTLAAPRQAPLWSGKSLGIAQAPAECSRAPGRSEFLAILQLKVQLKVQEYDWR